jgi:WXG100 family type VII secretion target
MGNQIGSATVKFDMTTPESRDTLGTDFGLMSNAAAATEARGEEVRGLLRTFIADMTAVPPTVWSGAAASTFRDVVERWNAESMRLCAALEAIAETIRANESALRAAAERHAQALGAATADL